MDFFESQETARRKTKALVFYFFAAVITIVAAIYLVCLILFARPQAGFHSIGDFWNARVFLTSALGALAIISIGSIYKMCALSRGGAVVAASLGGRPVPLDTSDPDEKKLRNVIEEMAIASGVPVPEIFVLPEEQAINAFAAGNSPDDAAIGVTQGAVTLLNRDELQGVIAHEFSHILNGDMRLNLRLMGFIHGILLLALIGRVVLRGGGRGTRRRSGGGKKGGANAILLLAVALLVIGYIGVFFARLIKSAVSRQREFLADAAAVQFTRNPNGLAGALKKIGGLAHGSRLTAAQAEEASHLFFGNGLRESWFSMMATHPPLAERIRRIEPSFDGGFPRITKPAEAPVISEAAASYTRTPSPIKTPADRTSNLVRASAAPGLSAARALNDVGRPTLQHLDYAAQLRLSFPSALESAAHEPFSATALVYALLLSPDPVTRAAQISRLEEGAENGIADETRRVLSFVESLDTRAKLPVIELALPALRCLSPNQFQSFKLNIEQLIRCDESIDLFEFTLQKIVLRHLEPHFGAPPKRIVQFYSIRAVSDETVILLSALAHLGSADDSSRTAAFQNGIVQVFNSDATIGLLPLERCDLGSIDAALDKISECTPQIKKMVLTACAHTVAADGLIRTHEAELLRAIADAFDCPLPPFLPPQKF